MGSKKGVYPKELIGHGFQDKPEKINRQGQPKQAYKYLKDVGYSREDIKTVFKYLAFKTERELKSILSDPNEEGIFKILAKTYLKGIRYGYDSVKSVFEYVLGRPDTADEDKDILLKTIQLSFKTNDKKDGEEINLEMPE